MAKWCALLIVTMLALASCQPTTSTTVSLPKPNFDAPVIAKAPGPTATGIFTPRQAAPAAPVKTVAQTGPKEWVPTAQPRQWKWIIIHHSATTRGGAVAFDKMHKAKGWDELGYHFVIGNGTDTKDGLIEVGSRWPKQKWGAHAKTADNRYNDYGIGICLVGNFDIDRPTAAQMQSVSKLVAYLMKTYKIPASNVLGHGETKATDCPGKNMSIATVRKMATQMIADGSVEARPTPDIAQPTEQANLSLEEAK